MREAPRILNNRAYAERLLAEVLGLNPNDRVQAAPEERTPPALPPSEDAAIHSALQSSRELRSLEARLLAKGFDIRTERAGRLPFERHNGQLGVSIQIPLWTGPRVDAAVAQAEAEAAQLRLQIRSARSRITAETARWYQEVKQAESARDLARLDLEVAREQVTILLAQAEEGRAGLRQLEEARSAETDKWLAFYDSAAALEKARLSLLKQTGALLTALH